MAVTIYDVAKEAGVSIATVSKALNDSYTIPEQTKENIREIAKRLEYRPNSRAKNFARQASGTVLFISDLHQNIAFDNPHMLETVSGIAAHLDQKGYSLMLKPLNKQDVTLCIKDIVQQRQADAIIIHADVLSEELAVILSRVDFPYLVIGKPPFRNNICWIDINNAQAGNLAANYLLDKGYRRMAFVMGQMDDALAQVRLSGITEIMDEEELSVEVVCNPSPYELDEIALDKLLDEEYPPEVLICCNNHLALRCLQHIHRRGMKIPEEIAILTFDNYPFSMLTDPAITAVNIDMREMGINAARFILQRIRKPNLQTQSYCTSPCILERNST